MELGGLDPILADAGLKEQTGLFGRVRVRRGHAAGCTDETPLPQEKGLCHAGPEVKSKNPELKEFKRLEREITDCVQCRRLRAHCETVAREKRRAYLADTYWGKPIMGFGDPGARLVMVGLAPAAHGANRTGRIFTGDRSGDWLFRALHRAGFANQPTATAKDDGLRLIDAYVTSSVRCAPPDNRPLPDEFAACAPFLARELALLSNTRVYVALGGIALEALRAEYGRRGQGWKKSEMKFKHGARYLLPDGRVLICSYHPSQQNTFTGRLTEKMFDAIFSAAREAIEAD